MRGSWWSHRRPSRRGRAPERRRRRWLAGVEILIVNPLASASDGSVIMRPEKTLPYPPDPGIQSIYTPLMMVSRPEMPCREICGSTSEKIEPLAAQLLVARLDAGDHLDAAAIGADVIDQPDAHAEIAELRAARQYALGAGEADADRRGGSRGPRPRRQRAGIAGRPAPANRSRRSCQSSRRR